MYREIEVKDFLPVLLEQLKFSESILDIGSGTGTLLERYEATVVLGLDIHRPYLLHRKYKAPISFRFMPMPVISISCSCREPSLRLL